MQLRSNQVGRVAATIGLVSTIFIIDPMPAEAQVITLRHRGPPVWSRQTIVWDCDGAKVNFDALRTYRQETGLRLATLSVTVDGQGVDEPVLERLKALLDRPAASVMTYCLGMQPIVVIDFAAEVQPTTATDTFNVTMQEESIELIPYVSPKVRP